MSALPKIRFESTSKDFTATLNNRVNDYFKTNGLDRHANSEMVIKTIFMFSLYLVPYFLIVTNTVTGTGFSILLAIAMGVATAGIGLSVMHDGVHGAYSKKPKINKLIGYSLNLIGASSFNWKVQHNVLHHSFTNIHEADEDISHKTGLRINPHDEWKWYHKYQFVYAWFLYGLMSLGWVIYADFPQFKQYIKDGWVKQQRANEGREWFILIATKLLYVVYIYVIPLLVTPWSWWEILVGLLIMHYVTGFILAVVFQPAHVTDATIFPQPDENLSVKDNWSMHQLRTTMNFANKSRWFTWYVGGLNFQIEHHLFPQICHVHYPKIAPIVEATAREFNVPYLQVPTFANALQKHLRILKDLGQAA